MRMKSTPRTLYVLLLLLGMAIQVAPARSAELSQVNPAQKAPDTINASGKINAYPWFSNDGKLFLFTRKTAGDDADVWVSYIKNRAAFDNYPEGGALPGLDLAEPQPLEPVNASKGLGDTIKAIAYCENERQPIVKPNGNLRYRFKLFYSMGPLDEGTLRKIYRAWNVIVIIRGDTKEIVRVSLEGQIQEMGPNVNRPGKNQTEPMLTLDGRYMFWASSDFIRAQARFIGPVDACTQLNQPTDSYSELPSDRFSWKDQYTFIDPVHATSRTNYHSIIEEPNGGPTALLFERCHPQQALPCNDDPSSRYCDCAPNYNDLSTTGFRSGREPGLIADCCGSGELNTSNKRESHPAVSGPRDSQGSWLLFFKRSSKIWYTKVK